MVFVDADGLLEQPVRIAAELADKFKAVLIGLSAFAMPPPMVASGMVIDAPTDVDFELMRAKLSQNGTRFASIAAAGDRKLEWRSELAMPGESLVRQARSADLVVIGATKLPGGPYNSLDPGAAILSMGRPTLVIPEGAGSSDTEHVVIGWKDTREARRAVQDALPFLETASRITVVEACKCGEESMALARLNDVSMYLKRHRIECGRKVMIQQEGSGSAQLIGLAQAERAGLLVTGAYGHSRLGEWMFGGMTRELLANSPICCLMSH
jgi:nucleotide-binding universal stress UspA family protein